MALRKNVVTQLLMHWGYWSLLLSHPYIWMTVLSLTQLTLWDYKNWPVCHVHVGPISTNGVYAQDELRPFNTRCRYLGHVWIIPSHSMLLHIHDWSIFRFAVLNLRPDFTHSMTHASIDVLFCFGYIIYFSLFIWMINKFNLDHNQTA